MKSLSIFLPSYNEASNLVRTIRNATEAVTQLHITDYEIIVVNDGSSDDTVSVVEEIITYNEHVRLITHPNNLGYGAALLTGFKNSSKDWIFFTDGDGQFDINELKRLEQYTRDYEIIIGYRIERNDPLMRLLNAKGWKMLNQFLFGLTVKDIDCAFKLFKKSAIEKVIPKMQSGGAMISAELLIRLLREGYDIAEVGVNHFPRTKGSATGAKPHVILRAFKELSTVYRKDLGSSWVNGVISYIKSGVFNTVVDISMYILLTRFIPYLYLHKMVAKGLSYIMGSGVSFFNQSTFDRQSAMLFIKDIIPVLSISVAGLAVNVSVMYVCFELFGFHELVAVILATIASLTIKLGIHSNNIFK